MAQFWEQATEGLQQGFPMGVNLAMQILQQNKEDQKHKDDMMLKLGLDFIKAGQYKAGKAIFDKHLSHLDVAQHFEEPPTVEIGGKDPKKAPMGTLERGKPGLKVSKKEYDEQFLKRYMEVEFRAPAKPSEFENKVALVAAAQKNPALQPIVDRLIPPKDQKIALSAARYYTKESFELYLKTKDPGVLEVRPDLKPPGSKGTKVTLRDEWAMLTKKDIMGTITKDEKKYLERVSQVIKNPFFMFEAGIAEQIGEQVEDLITEDNPLGLELPTQTE